MQITIHVTSETLEELRNGSSNSAAVSELMKTADEFHVQLRPLHPGASDPTLASTYAVDIPEAAEANTVVRAFQSLSAIRSAYFKPPPQMP